MVRKLSVLAILAVSYSSLSLAASVGSSSSSSMTPISETPSIKMLLTPEEAAWLDSERQALANGLPTTPMSCASKCTSSNDATSTADLVFSTTASDDVASSEPSAEDSGNSSANMLRPTVTPTLTSETGFQTTGSTIYDSNLPIIESKVSSAFEPLHRRVSTAEGMPEDSTELPSHTVAIPTKDADQQSSADLSAMMTTDDMNQAATPSELLNEASGSSAVTPTAGVSSDDAFAFETTTTSTEFVKATTSPVNDQSSDSIRINPLPLYIILSATLVLLF